MSPSMSSPTPMSLEEAISKAVNVSAQRFGLKDRGLLVVGVYADITIFDQPALRETSDHLDPRRCPQGIKYVIISGEIVIEAGEHAGARKGEVLR